MRVASHDFFKSVSKVPRQKKVVNILVIEYIHRSRQISNSELKLIQSRNKRGRKYKLRPSLFFIILVLKFDETFFSEIIFYSHRILQSFIRLEDLSSHLQLMITWRVSPK
jgi:hypothetical protein